jgi:hypothetical protein
MSDLQMETVVGFRRHEPFLTRGPPTAYLFLMAAYRAAWSRCHLFVPRRSPVEFSIGNLEISPTFDTFLEW